MRIIPQIYLKNKKVVAFERTITPLFDEDPYTMTSKIKDSGGEAVYVIDLQIPHVGASENAPVLEKIIEELGLEIIIGGQFRNAQAVETFISMGIKLVAFNTIAYQQPNFVRELCTSFPDNIAVHIDVRANHVTIPGWTVASNKTALDYAAQFSEIGIKTFFYSDVSLDGLMKDDNFNNILMFCKKVNQSVLLTSELRGPSDIEKLITLGAPHLDGVVLAQSLFQGRIDLRAAIGLIADLSIKASNEPTLLEE